MSADPEPSSIGDDKPDCGADEAQNDRADDGGHERVDAQQGRWEVADLQVEIHQARDPGREQQEPGIDEESHETQCRHPDGQRHEPDDRPDQIAVIADELRQEPGQDEEGDRGDDRSDDEASQDSASERWTTWPATTVRATVVPMIDEGPSARISRSRTTRSASAPTRRVPRRSSANAAYAEP